MNDNLKSNKENPYFQWGYWEEAAQCAEASLNTANAEIKRLRAAMQASVNELEAAGVDDDMVARLSDGMYP